MPIPPELRANAGGTIALDSRPGSMRILGDKVTSTYGINGPYLGPAIRVRRGEKVVAQVTNSLPENTTMHWHGLIIPGANDGGPHQVITPGKQWQTELAIDQPAATLWFHPHYYPSTAQEVIKGLAGLLIVDDEEVARLPLPTRWGVDDIPLVIQDRRFTPDGQFFDRMNIVAITFGYIGDTMLVNVAIYPEARTARGWLRFRILNGSNARSYTLAASDNRSLYVIASDGGLLESPVELKELLVHAGERFEVMVDARDGRPSTS
jgi:blue copper oxidase